MITPQPPRSATDLFPDSLRLSPKQREVLSALQEFPDGARAVELAAKLGMHVNTARGHLEELIARDAVRTATAPAQGRGRPSLIFQVRIPDNSAVAREYISLIEVLSSTLGDPQRPDAESMDRAREIGRQWAKHMVATEQSWRTIDDALSPLFQKLRDMGFDPSLAEGPASDDAGKRSADLDLLSCPFIAGNERPSPFICAIHEGFIRYVVGDGGPIAVQLKPFAGEGRCSVNLSQQEDQTR